MQTGIPYHPVVPREDAPLEAVYIMGTKYRSRNPVKAGAEARGWRLHSEVVKHIGVLQPSRNGSVCVSGYDTLSILL